MKYFGQKSLSSVIMKILQAAWFVVLIGSVLGSISGGAYYYILIHRNDAASEFSKCLTNMSASDLKSWYEFNKLPLAVRLVVIPYFASIVVLLLVIIKKAQQVFTNFRNNIVFNRINVNIISKINKLFIAFSIITFNFSALLICILLLMLCEIIKNGTVLQEEHDLTI